jgi:hypothetical protein
MGRSAVVPLVRHLDDRRPYKAGLVSFENTSPKAFEGRRHYRPALVLECLAAILNQITGRGFDACDHNGEKTRPDECVKAWTRYVASPAWKADAARLAKTRK